MVPTLPHNTPHIGAAAIVAGFDAVLAGLVSVSASVSGASDSRAADGAFDEVGGEKVGVKARAAGPNPFRPKPYSELSDVEKRALLDTNDKGMAERMTHYSKGRLIYTSQTGWLVWDGNRFLAEDGDALARRQVMNMIAPIKNKEYAALKEAGFSQDEQMMAEIKRDKAIDMFIKRIARLWGAAITLGNNAKQKAVLEVAAAMPEFLVRFNDLDAKHGAINTANGVIDFDLSIKAPKPAIGMSFADIAEQRLNNLKVRKVTVKDRITRVARAEFDKKSLDEDADIAPYWREHLNKILPDKAMQKTVQRILGSMLVTYNPGDYWFLFRGPGGDGKSTTLRAVQHAMGDHAVTGDVKTFVYDSRASAAGPREDLIRLAGGNRFVILPEPEAGDLLAGGVIKKTTGGDEFSTRGGYSKQIEFKPKFKMIMMCNPRPRVKGDDEGFWRRTIEIPFRHPIPKDQRDPQIDAKLMDEKDGIFLWLLEGLCDWWSRGYDYDVAPAAVSATNAYRREASPLAAWMQDRIIWGRWYDKTEMDTLEPGLWRKLGEGNGEAITVAKAHYLKSAESNSTKPPKYSPTDIFEDFCAWNNENGLDPWKLNSFTKAFSTRAADQGCENGRGNQGRFWTGFDFTTGAAKMNVRSADEEYGGGL